MALNRREGSPRRSTQRNATIEDLLKEMERNDELPPVPEAGDNIYVPAPVLGIMRRSQKGGRATVSKVMRETTDDETLHLVRVDQHPRMNYPWEGPNGIGWRQNQLEEEYGDQWAVAADDSKKPFNL